MYTKSAHIDLIGHAQLLSPAAGFPRRTAQLLALQRIAALEKPSRAPHWRATDFGSTNDSSGQPKKAELPILVTEFAIVTLFNEMHPAKAVGPIEVTELGIVKLSNELHPWKAECPILVTELGIVIISNEVHPSKAESPISVTEFGMVTLFKELHPEKASFPM